MNDDQMIQDTTTQEAVSEGGIAGDFAAGATPAPEAVDSQGTDAETARAMLHELRDKAFDGSDEKFGIALGRPTAEVTALMNGNERVDDDVVMKARGIAQQRGVELSQ